MHQQGVPNRARRSWGALSTPGNGAHCVPSCRIDMIYSRLTATVTSLGAGSVDLSIVQLRIEHKLTCTSHGKSTARGNRRSSLAARTSGGGEGCYNTVRTPTL